MSIDIIAGLIAGSIFMLLVAIFIVILIFRYRQKQFQNKRTVYQMKSNFQQELLRTQLEIQEQTLRNIGEEIHDNIGQTLSLVKLNLNTIDPELKNGWKEKIVTSKELVGKAIHDLRMLSRTLNTDTILSGGLIRAIEFELQLIDKAGVFQTELKVLGEPLKMDPQKELILFRVVQEAINNIIKHANAAMMIVSINYSQTELRLSVQDDGKGFGHDGETEGKEPGSGLRNMQNRAQLLGGSFHIESAETGTEIQITVPIHKS